MKGLLFQEIRRSKRKAFLLLKFIFWIIRLYVYLTVKNSCFAIKNFVVNQISIQSNISIEIWNTNLRFPEDTRMQLVFSFKIEIFSCCYMETFCNSKIKLDLSFSLVLIFRFNIKAKY